MQTLLVIAGGSSDEHDVSIILRVHFARLRRAPCKLKYKDRSGRSLAESQ